MAATVNALIIYNIHVLLIRLYLYRGSYTSGHFMWNLWISYEMTTSVTFCLSYNPLKWDFIAFKMNIISIRKCIVDMDVVNDVTCTRQSVFTCVVIRVLRHEIIHWLTSTSCLIQLAMMIITRAIPHYVMLTCTLSE